MTRPAPADDRESRLPRWAQGRIAELERRLQAAEAAADAARLATAPAESDTLIDPHEPVPIGLGTGPRVRFLPAGPGDTLRRWVDVRVDPFGYVEVMGGDVFAIEPQSSNLIRIRVGGA